MQHVLLLRGVNLGPRNRISMPELRGALERAGFQQVRTYLQSGNVLLYHDAPPERVAAACRERIAEAFGLELEVIARTREQLAQVVKRNPLGDVAVDPKRYQVSFLAGELDDRQVRELAALAAGEERFVAIGRELYAWHPRGVARSKLWSRLASPRLGVPATARNWTTVTQLLAMCEA
jgi:uncharacterized protein (DUF1697 family)